MNEGTGRVRSWRESLGRFAAWERLGGSSTQSSSRVAEDFFQAVTAESFPDAWILRLSSQERMDFAIGSRSVESAAIHGIRRSGGRNPTEYRLKQWQETSENATGMRFAFVQVKSGNRTFTLNDTFPPPDEELLYVFFDYGNRSVHVTTSAHMAVAWRTSPPIPERYARSAAAERDFGRSLKEIWDGTPVGTRPRPTYTIGRDYAANEAPIESLTRVLSLAQVL